MKVFVTLKVTEQEKGDDESTTFAFDPFPKGHEFECAQIVVNGLHESAEAIGGIAATLELVSVTQHKPDGDVTLSALQAKAAAKAHYESQVMEAMLAKGVPPEALGLPPKGALLDS